MLQQARSDMQARIQSRMGLPGVNQQTNTKGGGQGANGQKTATPAPAPPPAASPPTSTAPRPGTP
jgi:hypothetical protein